jgi:hypothetical protein
MKNNIDILLEQLFDETDSLEEMPIRQFQKIGNFDKNSSFGKVDRALLSSPKAVEKIHKQWQKTPHTFDMYLVNDPRVNKQTFREVGEVNLDYVRNKMKLSPQELPDPPKDAITIIFTNNVGDERYMASGWILAHRLGHALARGNSKSAEEWETFTKELRTFVHDILDQVYDVQVGIRDAESDRILKLAAQQLGTMKSARDSNLRNWSEFAYELLAQYLLTGHVKFKELPEQFLWKIGPYGRKSLRGTFSQSTREMYNRHDLDYYAQGMETFLDNVLDRAEGKIYVM